jgi:hypothetical protein
MPDGARLCINCARPVPGVPKAAQVADALLGGMTHLFCRCVWLNGLWTRKRGWSNDWLLLLGTELWY